MDKPISVLVVDDAVVVRRMVSDVLAEDPDIRVVGSAANGRIALQKIAQSLPDVVTLDIEMPDIDGLATLREIRRAHPRLPVIMFSTLSVRGASQTLEALALGASDYVTKPANVGSVAAAQQRIRDELIPKLKALCGRAAHAPALAPREAMPPTPDVPGPPEAVVIGVSTGGPNALAEVLPALPGDFPVPILVVQHMPPMFTKMLADRLDAQCALRVTEALGNEAVSRGTVYIAQGGFHLRVERRGPQVVTVRDDGPPENSCRPAVDVLFRSAVSTYGSRLVGVVMTGMGQDGLRGCEVIRRRQGQVIAQDQATSVVWGMPGFVANAGLAHCVVPLGDIAAELARRCGRGATAAIGART
jgi:two-component system chemotaxis response regulator CheB